MPHDRLKGYDTAGPTGSTAETRQGWPGKRSLTSALPIRPAPARDPLADATASGRSDLPYRADLERSLGMDLSGAEAYLGRGEALDKLGARAASFDNKVVFGSSSPSRADVAHEVVHYAQNQKFGASGAVAFKSTVSRRGDASEQEADALADRIVAGERVEVAARPSAGVQLLEHFACERKLPAGLLNITASAYDLKEAIELAGLSGPSLAMQMVFTAGEDCNDTQSIRFVQIVKQVEQTEEGPKMVWDANPKEPSSPIMQGVATRGEDVLPGYFVDANWDYDAIPQSGLGPSSSSSEQPSGIGSFVGRRRTKRTDGQVNPYYDATGPNAPVTVDENTNHQKRIEAASAIATHDPGTKTARAMDNTIGMKQDDNVVPAILVDTPMCKVASDFDFLTAIHDQEHNAYLGFVRWGFRIQKDQDKGYVTRDVVIDVLDGKSAELAQATIEEAVVNFNEYFGNQGAYSSPEVFHYVTGVELDTLLSKYGLKVETFDVVQVLHLWAEENTVNLPKLLAEKILALGGKVEDEHDEDAYRRSMLGTSLVGGDKTVDDNHAKRHRDTWPAILESWAERERDESEKLQPKKAFKKPIPPNRKRGTKQALINKNKATTGDNSDPSGQDATTDTRI